MAIGHMYAIYNYFCKKLTAEHLSIARIPCICKPTTESTFLFPNILARS